MPFAPTDLANLWAWYNAGNVSVTGSTLDSLTDLSGNSRTLTPSNPLYKASRVSVGLNGLPTIANNGTNGSAYVTAANFPLLDTTNVTIYIVAKKVSGDGSMSHFLSSTSGFNIGEGYSTDNDKVGGESGRGTPLQYALKPVVDDDFYTLRLRVTGGSYYFTVNNGTEGTNTQGTSFSAGPMVLFGDISNKQIAEVVVYTANVTGNDSDLVEYYLQQKYDHYTWSGAVPTTDTTTVLTFPSLPTKTVGDADFSPGATSNSPAAITYSSSNTAVATIVSGSIHIVGAGTSTITAMQGAATGYTDPADVTRTLTVNALTTTTMAQVNGVDVVLSLSTDGTTWKTLVCETENGIDQNTDTTSTQTKCDGGAVLTSPGATSWVVNASGAVNPDPDTDEVSYADLQGYWKNKTLVYAKIDDSGAGFKHSGSGYVTKLSLKNPTNGPSTFDFTLTGTGALTIS